MRVPFEPPITEAAVLAECGITTVAKGRDYQKRHMVLQTEIEGNEIFGTVAGTASKPYVQNISVKLVKGRWKIEGTCSCPIGYNCKHVAAVMLEVAKRQAAQKTATAVSPKAAPTIPVPPLETGPDLVELPPDPAVVAWLASLDQTVARPETRTNPLEPRIQYLLSLLKYNGHDEVRVNIVFGKLDPDGESGLSGTLKLEELKRATSGKDSQADVVTLRGLERSGQIIEYGRAAFRLQGEEGAYYLDRMADSGRAIWHGNKFIKLRRAGPRKMQLRWQAAANRQQILKPDAEGVTILPMVPPWYIDEEAGMMGPFDLGMPAPVYRQLVSGPGIAPEHTAEVAATIARVLPDHPELLPVIETPTEIRAVAPTPRLVIRRGAWSPNEYGVHARKKKIEQIMAPVAKLEFFYHDVRAKHADTSIRAVVDDVEVVMPRQLGHELHARAALDAYGWRPANSVYGWKPPKGYGNDLALIPVGELREAVVEQMLFEFLDEQVPKLRAEGWRIEVDGGLETISEQEFDWNINAEPEGTDWFSLELGISIEGSKVELRPILIAALSVAERKTQSGLIEDLKDDQKIFHEMPNGKVLVVPVSRLKPLVRTLTELFGPVGQWDDELRIPSLRAGEISELDEAARQAGLNLRAPERLLEMSRRLANFDQVEPVSAPEGLKGSLRPYQEAGLAWLQFLRSVGFGGILADDMGLGKTVQTLAHILVEKESGRLDRPVLIVAPTSTLPNWRHEAERFAPSLRLVTLHGAQRSKQFPELADADLALTSYALLARDREALVAQPFYLVVLDEAQNIKNPTTAMAKAACALTTTHRLCLSGTPVENHLEELWSIFHFLSPGLFGTLTDFRRDFRVPIEKQDDRSAQRRLVRRTKPFILRRTKELVAKELPPKTEFIERVELDGPQRDLYESLRIAMDERVRDLLSTKGFERSRIEMLDALLKLRQACCDPRLVKLDSAKGVTDSAKLERLMEMLQELQERGRRVLIFSQFTSMLDLIELEFKSREWDWVRISGDTIDRDTPVKRFQNKEVPLFLISLKAGGTGLNLTAADTVIHYDPWWNPAVERQATDRAHRIGQVNSVFVYKLVAEGSVEEKILELQERKARIAGAILDENTNLEQAITSDDLKWIFEKSDAKEAVAGVM